MHIYIYTHTRVGAAVHADALVKYHSEAQKDTHEVRTPVRTCMFKTSIPKNLAHAKLQKRMAARFQ